MKGARRKVSIILLVAMAIFLMADQQLLPPNYLEIQAEFLISEAQIGLVSTIYIAVGALIAIAWGYLSDVHDRKKLLVIGILIGEIPCFLTAFVQSYWQLLAIRVFTGFGIGSIFPIGYSLISDMFSEEKRGRGYSYIQTALGFGTLIGMIIAGLMVSWRTPFIIASVPNFIIAPLFYFVYEEPERGEGEKEIKDLVKKGKKYTYSIDLETIKKSFKTKTNILIFAQGILGTVPWGVLMFWLITFLRTARGMDKTIATFVLLILGIGTGIGTLVGGFAGDYFEEKTRGGRALLSGIAITIGMIASIFLILYPLPSEPGILTWVGLIIYTLLALQFISFADPNVRAIISQVNLPEDRGTIFGIFNVIDNAGKAIGPLFGGILVGVFEFWGFLKPVALKYTLIISTLFWVPSALIWFWIRFRYPEDRDNIKSILKDRKEEILSTKEVT